MEKYALSSDVAKLLRVMESIKIEQARWMKRFVSGFQIMDIIFTMLQIQQLNIELLMEHHILTSEFHNNF